MKHVARITFALLSLAGSIKGQQAIQYTNPVVLYGRTVNKEDVKPSCSVWCNVNENKPAQIKGWGASVVFAYVNAGAWEAWYEQKIGDKFAQRWAKKNPDVLGISYPDWPDERWLDIRTQKVRDYVTAQVEWAKSQGFDGIDFDNLNLDQQETGFRKVKNGKVIDKGVTWEHQRVYAAWLVSMCRMQGLLVSLRHVKDPKGLEPQFQPNVWLIESAFEDNFWKQYVGLPNHPTVINVEYAPLPPISKVGKFGWVIRANRELSVNHQTIQY